MKIIEFEFMGKKWLRYRYAWVDKDGLKHLYIGPLFPLDATEEQKRDQFEIAWRDMNKPIKPDNRLAPGHMPVTPLPPERP